MGVTFADPNERFQRTANLPATNAFTISGWAKYTAETGYHNLFWMSDADDTPELAIALYDADLYVQGDNGNGTFSSSPGTNTWFFWALTGDTGGYDGWWGTGSTLNNVYGGSIGSLTPTKMYLGNDAFSQRWGEDGAGQSMCWIKMWDAALSETELLQEMRTIRPVKTANLHIWSPLFNASTTDFSGNGYDWTINDTPDATTLDAPVSWGAPVWTVREPAAGGGGGGDSPWYIFANQ